MSPTAATMPHAGQSNSSRGDSRTLVSVPFIRASGEHREPTGIDITRQLTASDQDLGVFDIPAYGYVRSIILEVTATGGAGTGVAATEDGPFSVIKNIALTEPNGAPLSSFNSGHSLYLANKWGGYRAYADPKSTPVYSAPAATTGNFSFMLRIPVEINPRDGLGSLPNQNAAATFKLRLALAKLADVYSTSPATAPQVRVRAYIEAWDQPEAQSAGAVNQISPPAVNTTQFWSEQIFSVNAGNNTIRLTRVGNYLRNVIFVLRRGATSRANGESDWQNDVTLLLDTRPLDIISNGVFRNQMYERSGYGGSVGTVIPANDAAGGLDNGVRVYDFMHEFNGSLGFENRDLWLPTLSSSRLEIQANFPNAGVLSVLTNDVAVSANVWI